MRLFRAFARGGQVNESADRGAAPQMRPCSKSAISPGRGRPTDLRHPAARTHRPSINYEPDAVIRRGLCASLRRGHAAWRRSAGGDSAVSPRMRPCGGWKGRDPQGGARARPQGPRRYVRLRPGEHCIAPAGADWPGSSIGAASLRELPQICLPTRFVAPAHGRFARPP